MTFPILKSAPNADVEQGHALTAAQTGIWLGQQLDPKNPAYWTAETVNLQGALDCDAFCEAVNLTLDACEGLHAIFYCEDGALWQQRTTSTPRDGCRFLDFSLHTQPQGSLAQWIDEQLSHPANLTKGPLFSTALIRLEPECHVWFFRAHHIILDGYGYALIARRVASRYTAWVARMPPQGSEFHPWMPVLQEDAVYQRSAQHASDRAFWQAQLQDRPSPVLLAAARPLSHQVRRQRQRLADDLLGQWQAAAKDLSVDWPSWFVACVATYIQRATGATSLTLGLPVMGRLGSAALNVPCMAMNIVPLYLEIDPAKSFADLALHVCHQWRALRPHQRYRHEHMKQDLNRAPGQRLFGAVVNLMPFDRPLQFAGLTAESLPLAAGPVEDLAFNVWVQEGCLQLSLEANPDAYAAGDLSDHATALLQTQTAALHHPDKALRELPISVLADKPPHRRDISLLQGEATQRKVLDVLEQWRLHCGHAPASIVLEHAGHAAMTQAELLRTVQKLAGWLTANGIQAGDRIAVMLPRSQEAISSLLAILWVGAVWVPLDPSGPKTRQQQILTDLKPAKLITLKSLADQISADQPLLMLDTDALCDVQPLLSPFPVQPDDAAYIIYTSGSTGKPKGVVIRRGGLAHFISAACEHYGVVKQDRILQFAPLHFDACIEEIFLALCSGGHLILRTDEMLSSLSRFLTCCEEQAITVLDLPTAFWHEIALQCAQLSLPESLRLVIIGGEAVQSERVVCWQQHAGHIELLNTYGPTETTVVCCAARLTLSDTESIGTPLPGTTAVVVNAHLDPVAPGESGELCVIGPTLAEGYLGLPEQTADRFVNLTALPGQPRAYRSGDRVRVNADGQLCYLGRLDDEFKLSGHRIAPAEVEAVLSACPGISDAAVVGCIPANGAKQLVAFIATPDACCDQAALRAWLGDRLFAAAIPSAFIPLPNLPRTRNNKIDRHALQNQALVYLKNAQADGPPSLLDDRCHSPLYVTVQHIWQAVLGVNAIGPDADFFALGGKSLAAIQVVSRLSTALTCELEAAILFQHSTLAALTQKLAERGLAPAFTALSGTGCALSGAPRSGERRADLANDVQPLLAPLINLQPGRRNPGLFCIHPADGLSWCYLGLARHLPDIPLWGLQANGITGELSPSFEVMVDEYTALILQAQRKGPYRLLGWSSGGGIAQAIAASLTERGEVVDLLVIMDGYPSESWRDTPPPTYRDALLTLLDDIEDAFDSEGRPLDEKALLNAVAKPGSSLAGCAESLIKRMADTALHSMRSYRKASHPIYAGEALFFRATQGETATKSWQGWRPYLRGNIKCIDLDCHHFAMHQPAALRRIGTELRKYWTDQS